jgi:hypothetical protein
MSLPGPVRAKKLEVLVQILEWLAVGAPVLLDPVQNLLVADVTGHPGPGIVHTAGYRSSFSYQRPIKMGTKLRFSQPFFSVEDLSIFSFGSGSGIDLDPDSNPAHLKKIYSTQYYLAVKILNNL